MLRTYPAAVAGLSALALPARLAGLATQPVWRDEAFTAVVARRPLAQTLAAVSGDSHPPLSFVLAHLIGRVAGIDLLTLRLGSALAGVAAVPLAAALGRRVGGDRAGIAAAAVAALLPATVLLSRDARMYALGLTLVLAAVLALWRAVERPTLSRLVVFAACAALAAYTHYFGGLAIAVAVLAAAVALRPPRATLARVTAAAGVAALSLAPWLWVARAQFQHRGFWVPKPNLGSVSGMLGQPLVGQGVSRIDGVDALVRTSATVTLLLGWVAVGALLLWLRRRPAARGPVLYLVLCWAGVVAALLGISMVRPIFDPRYASVAWGPLAVVVGVGLSRLPTAWAGAALATLGLCGAALALTQHNPDFQPLAARLNQRLQPGDTVILGSPRGYYPVLYYLDPAKAPQVHMVSVKPVSWFWGVSGFLPGAVIPAVPDDGGAVYLVLEAGQKVDPVVPGDMVERDRLCDDAGCVVTFTR